MGNANSQVSHYFFEKPLLFSILFLWFLLIITFFVSIFFIQNEYTVFINEIFTNFGGVVLTLGIINSFVATFAFWSFLTFNARALHFYERFNQKLEEEKARTLHTAKLASLTEIASSIAHEINNPLLIISGNAEHMNRELSQNEHALNAQSLLEKSGKIKEQVLRINRIVKSLLKMSREIKTENFQLVNVESAIFEASQYLHEKLEQNDIVLDINLHKSSIAVMGHETELIQIFFNLINNSLYALKDFPPNKKRQIKIESAELHGFYYFKIIDSGGPLPKSTVEKIMTPFFTTKPIGSGTGLGLSISKNFANKMFGDLYYDEESVYTTFVVKLPMAS